MATRRAARVRALARLLSERFDVEVEAVFQAGGHWNLEWGDGPARATVAAAIEQTAPSLDGAELRLARGATTRAYALTALRLSAAGQFAADHRWSNAQAQVEDAWRTSEYPERADARQEALAAWLMAVASHRTNTGTWVSEYDMSQLIADRGLAWPLTEPDTTGADHGDDDVGGGRQPDVDAVPPAPALTALELLTSRYAQDEAARAWRERTAPMPASTPAARWPCSRPCASCAPSSTRRSGASPACSPTASSATS